MAVKTVRDDEDTIILAKLKRGKNYKHFWDGKYHQFLRNVPEEVSEELADELESLVDRIEDEDGEMIEKEYFSVDRNASPREATPEVKRIRIRTVREEVVDEPRKKPAIRKPLAPSKPAAGFGKRSVPAR